MYSRGKKPPGMERSPRKGAGDRTPYQQVKRATTLEEVQALVTGKVGGAKRKLVELAGGPWAQDPIARLEAVERMKAEARGRPPRQRRKTGKPNVLHRMTMTDTIEHVRTLEGEVMPAREERAQPPQPAANYAEGEHRLRAVGFEEVLNLLAEGHSQREVCKRLGVRQGHLNRWIDSMPEGQSRVRECRTRAAQAWLDRGLAVLSESESLAELAKAREIAQLCKKYAAISDPAFSDRVQVDTTVKTEDQASIDAKLRLIMSQVAQTRALEGDK